MAAAREQEQRIRALQREQARLLEELGRAQAALEQGATASSPAGAPSPPAQAPPSVDIGRLLRDQKDVLHAQHEAAISVRWLVACHRSRVCQGVKQGTRWGSICRSC